MVMMGWTSSSFKVKTNPWTWRNEQTYSFQMVKAF